VCPPLITFEPRGNFHEILYGGNAIQECAGAWWFLSADGAVVIWGWDACAPFLSPSLLLPFFGSGTKVTQAERDTVLSDYNKYLFKFSPAALSKFCLE
jgi:hypothetical protein